MRGGENMDMDSVLITGAEIAQKIDHTLLKPNATKDQIIQLCTEAKDNNFATVCVNPFWVPVTAKELKGSKVGITTVIGFPLGSNTTFAKVAEARNAITDGATEIDMVMNIGALRSGDLDAVAKDIEAVVQACKGNAIIKVILETGYLTDEEMKTACTISKSAGADFVKTCTGFGPGEATVEDIRLMRLTVGPDMGVKASAGIRDLDTARKMVAAGANRLGTSASIAIITGGTGQGY
jgi:deoxyribose-phosphate aldolase